MSSVTLSGRGTLGDRQVYRLGYGAMQLAGPGVFGPPISIPLISTVHMSPIS